MNDIRRTILWVIFGFSMILLWDQWQIYNGKAATFFPSPAKTATAPAAAASAAVPTASTAAVPATAKTGATAPVVTAETPAAKREKVVVSTDVLKLGFDTEGATLERAELLKHKEEGAGVKSPEKRNIVVLDNSKDRVYLAQTGLVGTAGYPTHKTVFNQVAGPRELKDGQDELKIRFESPEVGGLKLVKTYTLKRGAYDIAVQHDIQNVSAGTQNAQLYVQLLRDGNKPPGESSFYSTFTGPAVYTTEKKFEKVEFSDIEKGKAEFQKTTSAGYAAMVQHYFASAWLMADGVQRDMFMRKTDTNLYSVGMITAAQAIEPGTSKTVEARLFVGPQEEKKLEALYPGLELVKDYGWLTILAKPLYWLVDKLHGMLGNWGWSIVALVVLLKIAFYWLNASAYRSMAKMKEVNPRVMELRERLKDKPQEMQQAMMKLYRDEKVNPMGGCFPIVIQIPVFIALYWVLLATVEMRNAPWLGWITDLSSPDPYFILPLVMTGTTLLQTWLNPTPPDPVQAKLMWIMPLVFSVMFFFFPSGLVLYWLTNNILSIAQQYMINKQMGVLNK
ncbi:MAG: rane protein insertase YidC [Pseudomonadota bacterium]|jgi:YidC/Oxa1 family membrane protein insertase